MCDEISIKQLSQLKSIKGNDTNTYRASMLLCCYFSHFTVATASIRTVCRIFFPPSSSYRHHLQIGDDSKSVIKRNLFYFMLMGERGKRESLIASIYLYFACHISGLSVQSSSSKSAKDEISQIELWPRFEFLRGWHEGNKNFLNFITNFQNLKTLKSVKNLKILYKTSNLNLT